MLSFLPHEFQADNNSTQESCNSWNNNTDTKLPLLSAVNSNRNFYFLGWMAKANLVSVDWKLQFNIDGTFDGWNDLNCKVIKSLEISGCCCALWPLHHSLHCKCSWGYRDVGRGIGIQPCSVSSSGCSGSAHPTCAFDAWSRRCYSLWCIMSHLKVLITTFKYIINLEKFSFSMLYSFYKCQLSLAAWSFSPRSGVKFGKTIDSRGKRY